MKRMKFTCNECNKDMGEIGIVYSSVNVLDLSVLCNDCYSGLKADSGILTSMTKGLK